MAAVGPGTSLGQGSHGNQEGTLSARSCHLRPPDHPIQNAARGRCPWGGGSSSRPPLHLPSARGWFLLLRPPLEIWGCVPGSAGGCKDAGASHLIRGRELQLIDIEGRHQGDGVEAILQQHLLGALLREIVPQLHHRSGRPEAAACSGRTGRESPRAGPTCCPPLAGPRLVSREGS